MVKSRACNRCTSRRGALNGNWKGGHTYRKAGYLTVKTPGHPRATRYEYVFQHILVMEEILGRFLLPDEQVH
ncbi:MAG: hypothetical protein WDA27_09740, partial [Actinomycetota bacterium]